MDSLRTCGWSGCNSDTVVNSKSGVPFYYCELHRERRNIKKREYYKNNKDRWRVSNDNTKVKWQEYRQSFLDLYGHSCNCCGTEGDIFLTLDHVNNDGKVHRKQRGRVGVYQDALIEHQPDRFQVLCHNCNFAKYQLGQCPHQLVGDKLSW